MYFDELELGMTVNTKPAIIEKEKMLAFAREYDNIPLHTDEEYAKKTPLPYGQNISKLISSEMSSWRANRPRSNG